MLLVVADIDKQLVQIFLPTRISVESKLPVIYFQPNSERITFRWYWNEGE